ncbi:MAG TPA: hypothetical protein VGM19_11305 [Armatimonadota bacterium]|jgi:hypothetical protein
MLPVYRLGMEIQSLSDLAKTGDDLHKAGCNLVLARGPLGAAVIAGLWEANKWDMEVLLSSEGLGDPDADRDADRDWIQRFYDWTYWTRGAPAYRGYLLAPSSTPQYDSYLLAALAGNPRASGYAGTWLATGQYGSSVSQSLVRDAVFLSVEELLGSATGLSDQFPRQLSDGNSAHTLFAVLPGEGPGIEKLTEAQLLAVGQALKRKTAGIIFLAPANDQIREMQLSVIRQLAGGPGKPNQMNRKQVLAAEASSPLLWRMKRFGEVATAGLTPYATPDGTTGYSVTGRALLNLAILNRSAWVDAAKLTRFSMRMFSSGEGQAVLLALSTAGEVSYTRVAVPAGWHTYDLDLTKATWESQQPAGGKWGGSTGVVQGLSFAPVTSPGAQLAFDWIRLEPSSAGEVEWEQDLQSSLSDVQGLEGLTVADGELKGKATQNAVSFDLVLPAGGLAVKGLPFLSCAATPTAGPAQVQYWGKAAGKDQPGGTARWTVESAPQPVCVNLSRLGFAGATVAGAENWGGSTGAISRLRLTFPATPGQDWALRWVRLGPNYDLRSVPSEAAPEPPAELMLPTLPEPEPAPGPQ